MKDDKDIPEWLSLLIEDMAQCIECLPDTIDYLLRERPDPKDVPNAYWEIQIFPAATEIFGEVFYPPASICLSGLLDVFDEVDEVQWCDEGVTIDGRVDGNPVFVELYLQAPEGISPLTRLDPSKSSWVGINGNEVELPMSSPPAEDHKLSN
jgi:hypothetical protein